MLTLVVVPPALGLPSLDPECLAAISYFTRTVPDTKWELVADTQGISAGRPGTWQGLPALWDDDVLISGYERIVEHLEEISGGTWSLDEHLSSHERSQQYGALCTVSTRLRPLISLLLWTSPENYVAVTRPALATMLSFPTSWILPVHYREHRQSIASSLRISSAQLSAAALSLEKKQVKTAAQGSTARVDPLDDAEIVQPKAKPITEYIPFYGSTSAALAVHRELRQLVKEFLSIYGSYAVDNTLLLQNDAGRPTSLGCAVYAHLAIAIAAANAKTPHPFVTSVLHYECPELERLVDEWMDSEWNIETGSSTSDHARRRRAEVNKYRVARLPWKKEAGSVAQSSQGFAANWLRATGWVNSWSPLAGLEIREPLHYDSSGAVVFTSEKGTARGRGMGHQTDLLVGVTVAASAVLLGYQAWREGF